MKIVVTSETDTLRASPIRLMRFEDAVRRDASVDRWFETRSDNLGGIARTWFDFMRGLGDDVRELLHDGHPTACVGDAAFCYVDAFTAHVNVGFFLGSLLADPAHQMALNGARYRLTIEWTRYVPEQPLSRAILSGW